MGSLPDIAGGPLQTAEANCPATLLHDPFADPQIKATPGGLGGEEGFKELIYEVC